MTATTYTEAENDWTWQNKSSGYLSTGPLYLAWEVWYDPITDDYLLEDASAHELLGAWCDRLPDERTEEHFGPGAVGIGWYIAGKALLESAPFQVRRIGHDAEDFLSHFTWPENEATGERLNFNRLSVKDRLWREGRADKGGFIQEATGWKPSALEPVMWAGAVLAAAGLDGPPWS